ncbi:very long chain fatty acid elongase F-like [Cochliomyia hominivorax]
MLLLKLFFNLSVDHIKSMAKDPRTNDLPISNNYFLTITIMGLYVMFSLKIGPKLMANRKPYDLMQIIQFYNIFQFLLNLYVFVGTTKWYFNSPSYNWICMKYDITFVDPSIVKMRTVAYLYFLSKILDFLETIFFILRKKFNQVSFLHVYHHTAMLLATFFYMNQFFATQFTDIGFINSLVHVLMYTYYFLSTLDMKINIIWWKKLITTVQILQFFYISVKLFVSIWNNSWCGHPVVYLWLCFMQNMFLTALFMHFYWKTYIVKERYKKVK